MKGKLEPAERQKLIEGKNIKEGRTCFFRRRRRRGGLFCSKKNGSPQVFGFPIKDHLQLGKDLDLIDFDAATEVSGLKFYYLKNAAVLLEMALVNWTIAQVMRRGFTPLTTPEIVRSSIVEKCGFQPRGENTQIYSIEGSDQCLIGTAEIPVGEIHMDSIFAETSLPLKYVALSHCFRTEAGAAGTATRGLYRVLQFSKVEMLILCRPEESNSYHEELIRVEEDLFSLLGFHFEYQVHQTAETTKVADLVYGTTLKLRRQFPQRVKAILLHRSLCTL